MTEQKLSPELPWRKDCKCECHSLIGVDDGVWLLGSGMLQHERDTT